MTTPFTAASTLSLLDKAAHFVEDRMAHIPRRGGSTALEHCFAVAKMVAEANEPEETVAAALLHDVVEDTPTTMSEIRTLFGKEVARLVVAVTKINPAKDVKDDRKHIQGVELAGPSAVIIKLADNTHNISTPLHMRNPKRYLRYAQSIQDMGCRVLGKNHKLVIAHFSMLRAASLAHPNA